MIAFAREKFGRLDLLVNNAGMAPRERRDILEAAEDSFDELIGTNLKGPYFLTQLAARWMLERKSGRIVFVTSISSYTASVNRGDYCISKAGLSMAVALWAQRLAADNITVFELRPGIIRTDIHLASGDPARVDRIGATSPLQRPGEAVEVARAILWLLSDEASYMTGALVDVTGGR